MEVITSPLKASTTAPTGLTEEQTSGLTRLVTRLYCLPYSEEFRQPVQIKYPDLFEQYRSTILVPSDLGTILLKLKKRKYKSLNECNRELKLCFKNAIEFNADLSNLVSISNHLLAFTEHMWHEIIQTPFRSAKKGSGAHYQGGDELFINQVAKDRREHFEETQHMSLQFHEIQYLSHQLQQMQMGLTADDNDAFGGAFSTVATSCKIMIARGDGHNYPSLVELIAPFLEVMKTHFRVTAADSPALSPSSLLWPCFARTVYTSDTIPAALALQNNDLLRQLERVLGEVAAILFERYTRGFDMSAIWIKYNRVVWAQPNSGQPNKTHGSKRAGWWPGVVIAGSGVSAVQEAINISRIPPDLKAALKKLRPKSKDCASLNGGYVGTDALCLVEYFGTHDFGWCKTDVMFPYEQGGKFKLPEDKKEAGYSDTVTKDANAVEEADGSFDYMKSALEAKAFVPAADFLTVLEEKLANLPEMIHYTKPRGVSALPSQPVNGEHSPESGENTPESPKNNKRKRSQSQGGGAEECPTTETPRVESFSFVMYPSTVEDVEIPNNKRLFALRKTTDLCRYAQRRHTLTAPVCRRGISGNGRNSSGGAGGGSRKAGIVAAPVPLARHPLRVVEDETSGVGMCFAGISTVSSAIGTTCAHVSNKTLVKTSQKKPISGENGQESGTAEMKEEDGEHEKKEPKYTPKVLTFAGQTFAASIGCTQVIRNKSLSFVPVLHTRKIDHTAPVFFLEASSCAERKKVLKEEITRLETKLDDMADWLEFAHAINAKREIAKQKRYQDAADSATARSTAAAAAAASAAVSAAVSAVSAAVPSSLSNDSKKRLSAGEDKPMRPPFKKRMLAKGSLINAVASGSSAAVVGDNSNDISASSSSGKGVSRGKKQEAMLSTLSLVGRPSVMSAHYHPRSPEEAEEGIQLTSLKRKREGNDSDGVGNGNENGDGGVDKAVAIVDNDNEKEKLLPAAALVVKKKIDSSPKPFSGFTSVMNMMPSF